MLDRGNIIELAFFRLGETVQIYSDNMTEKHKIAEKLLENVVETLAMDTDFLFNATTVKLEKNINSKNDYGEYRYNIPHDFLSLIRYTDNMRMEREFVYSKNENLSITYCRKITIEEFPNYMKNYLVYKLAVELCGAYSAYIEKIDSMQTYLNSEMIKIKNSEGLVINNFKGE